MDMTDLQADGAQDTEKLQRDPLREALRCLVDLMDMVDEWARELTDTDAYIAARSFIDNRVDPAALAARQSEATTPASDHNCLMPSACGVTGFYCANSRLTATPAPARLDLEVERATEWLRTDDGCTCTGCIERRERYRRLTARTAATKAREPNDPTA